MPKTKVKTKTSARSKTPSKAPQHLRTYIEPRTSLVFPIVGIGASAGGLEAFTQLLQHVPADTGMGFVLVSHLDPDHKSALAEILARATAMPVHEVHHDIAVMPNTVYVMAPNTHLRMVGGWLKPGPRSSSKRPPHPIDGFLESLAEDRHEHAIGVILSGTASDGTVGLEAIKAADGVTFAQDGSAKYDSMPQSAIAAGCVDRVLAPDQIAAELVLIAHHPFVAGGVLATTDGPLGGGFTKLSGGTLHGRDAERSGDNRDLNDWQQHFSRVLLLLRRQAGVDFSQYKVSTIARRMTRRMVLSGTVTLSAYAKSLEGNTEELKRLSADLLINVTGFFRNPEVFEKLKYDIVPQRMAQRPEGPLRIWVSGCSSGQEAYSIAMVALECAESVAYGGLIQIFATDINEAVLDQARSGFYAKSLTRDVSSERLKRFFTEEPFGYRINKTVRQMIVFARQDLMSDPWFSRIDLVSCRNLLIYLEADAQKKVLQAFHYALRSDGCLLLGLAESTGTLIDAFSPTDKKFKIYVKAPVPVPVPVPAGPKSARQVERPGSQDQVVTPASVKYDSIWTGDLNPEREADRLVVRHFAPPGVLVNASYRIIQFRGVTSPYLVLPTENADLHVFAMVLDSLVVPLRTAIDKAKKTKKAVRLENVSVDEGVGDFGIINIEVMPLSNLKEPHYLIFFETPQTARDRTSQEHRIATRRGNVRSLRSKRTESQRVTALRLKLSEARDHIRALKERDQSILEQMQATTEEMQSGNEELQSINEELETSKEELESTNEELITVNEEMAAHNRELNRLNADLNNLHLSINMPILVLGDDLIIRQFTPPAERVFNLMPGDVGRPLGRVKHGLDCPDLELFIGEAIDTVSVREQEVQDKDGRWYVLRVRPYLTLGHL